MIGTLAPKSSPWGEVFSCWEKAVPAKSGGSVELEFFYNYGGGQEAPGDAMRAGRLGGVAAAVSSLGSVYAPLVGLQMPGLLSSWTQVDGPRVDVRREIEGGAREAGLAIVGWGDLGMVRVLTRGPGPAAPGDLRGRRVRVSPADPIGPALCSAIGATPVAVEASAVAKALEGGLVDVVFAPLVAAESMDWLRHLDQVTDVVVAPALGCVALAEGRVSALAVDLRAVLAEAGGAALAGLSSRVRAADDAVLRRLRERGAVAAPRRAELSKWQRLFREVRGDLSRGTLPKELVRRIEASAR